MVLRLTPPKFPEMVTLREEVTALVVIVKLALVLPAGTVTFTGTRATEALLLDNDTTIPPLGAGLLSVTFPVEVFPPTMVEGLEDMEIIAGRFTARVEDLLTPPYTAEVVTEVDVDTGVVVIVKVALVFPLNTVTVAGTFATEILLLDNDTTDPPVSAGPFSVTVPVEVFPPSTVAGVMANETRPGRMSNPTPFETPPSGLRTVTEIVPVAAMSAIRILACSWVDETKVVTRSVPFHRTFEPLTKSLPDTVSVKAALPAVAKKGLRSNTVGPETGALTSKVIALEIPPSGLNTVTGIVPTVAMSAARILACSWVGETKVVTRSVPFHRTFEPLTNSLPDTVSVKAALPAVAKEGLRPVTVGLIPSCV